MRKGEGSRSHIDGSDKDLAGTKMVKAVHKRAEWKHMTGSVRTGNMVKENMGKAIRIVSARRKYLGI